MALSALARHMRKNKMLKFGTGVASRRNSPRLPAAPGTTRGTMGSIGSTTLKSRNSDAGENRDRREFGLPSMPSSQIKGYEG